MHNTPDRLSTALALQQQGQFAAAEPIYRELLAENPLDFEALQLLGLVAFNLGRIDEAIELTRRAITLNPRQANYRVNLGCFLTECGQIAAAAAALREAIVLNPQLPQAHFNLGNALRDLGEFDDAIASYERALALRPNDPMTHNNLGIVLARQGKLLEAQACYRRVLEMAPNYLPALNNFGTMAFELADWTTALATYERVLHLNPTESDARFNRSLVWLLHGDYARGWPEYEYRWRAQGLVLPRHADHPRWLGEPLDGRTILVHAEQGLGDTLHFVRYLPLVAAEGGRVLFECEPAVRRLAMSVAGVDDCFATGDKLPPFDVQIPLLSLPGVFGTTEATIPREVPYLTAPCDEAARWKARFAELAGVKVGIAWQGDPKNRRDRARSIPLASFEWLAKIPGVHWFSLQKGNGSEQLAEVQDRWPIGDVVRDATDFADTAAIVTNLDLVISVDSAVAHLAGALDVPVWLAVPASPDWRWQLNREDSPWYPSMRLLRQKQYGCWIDVIERLALDLGVLAEQHRLGSRPERA